MWTGLTESDLRFWQEVATFARKFALPHVLAWDRDATFPRQLWRKIGRRNLLGLGLPKRMGGAGGDIARLALALDAFAYGSKDLGIVNSWGVHSAMAAQTIARTGVAGLRRRLLPALANGAKIGAFALTEPDAGSNIAAMRASIRRDGTGYVVSAHKVFVTNGPEADVFVIVARDSERGEDAYSAIVVERGTRGLTIGGADDKTCIRTSPCGDIRLKDCRVGAENLLGPRGKAMEAVVLPALDRDRCVVWAGRLGRLRAILEDATAYAGGRIQFGRPIARHQSILFKLASMKIGLETAESLLTNALSDLAAGGAVRERAAIAREALGLTTMASADDAFQIFGGYGFNPKNHVERYHRDARLDGIGGGTSEMQKIIIGKQLVSTVNRSAPWMSACILPQGAARSRRIPETRMGDD